MKNIFIKLLIIFMACNFFLTLAVDSKLQEQFTLVYEKNYWGDSESHSGSGSNLFQTSLIREVLPKIIKNLGVHIFIDAPCGDFFWMSKVDLSFLDRYIGIDIVDAIIFDNKHLYSTLKRSFYCLDIVNDLLPQGDLIFCRDCLVHLSYDEIALAIVNFKKTGAHYLLMTHFTKCRPNRDFKAPIWRPLNFELAPFFFVKPLLLINEGCTEAGGAYSDKSLGLWDLSAL
jgi:hypothetical protein